MKPTGAAEAVMGVANAQSNRAIKMAEQLLANARTPDEKRHWQEALDMLKRQEALREQALSTFYEKSTKGT